MTTPHKIPILAQKRLAIPVTEPARARVVWDAAKRSWRKLPLDTPAPEPAEKQQP